MSLSTPIAFIIFNRPDVTEKVFKAIRQAKPKMLLVIADGARPDKPGEIEKCAAARAIIDRVDWDCEILKCYSEINLGCGINVSQGITWVFKQVEEAIILEDDCLPHPTFFRFCEELLEKYRDDERVMLISGANVLGEYKSNSQSYYFSMFAGIWGWATWRRAWKLYDYEMKDLPQALQVGFLKNYFHNPEHCSYWQELFQNQCDDEAKLNTWDFQWLFSQWIQNGLGVIPAVNLISNLGFGGDATHTSGSSPLANMPMSPLDFPLAHPLLMQRDFEMDNSIQSKFFGKQNANLQSRILRKAKNLVTKAIAR
ncbi:MAG: glycosyltransferase family 2 protein [Thermosynechococcaceae cyanobacterium MS004]|nr:glycosyltransferase family 2 protein [Thermosynechococcaceae cyanobacterium MS004]